MGPCARYDPGAATPAQGLVISVDRWEEHMPNLLVDGLALYAVLVIAFLFGWAACALFSANRAMDS
jgi:hypothetical protein